MRGGVWATPLSLRVLLLKTIDSQDAAPENPNYMHRGDHKRRRVFILGAGVSASCGIPVAQSILRESLCRLAMTDASEVKKVHNLLAYLYPGFDADLRNYPNRRA